MYADFVDAVDAKGHVMDYLIQNRIVSDEVAQQVRGKETKQDRCRAMLHKLLSSRNPKAFVVLRDALERDYDYIVHEIDKGTYNSNCVLYIALYI